jgi:hypothetical protein
MICFDSVCFGFISVIIIIISYYLGKYYQQIDNLGGFYGSNNEFNKESGLSIFYLYIGDRTKISRIQNKLSYNGYLLMTSNNEDGTNNVLINEKIEFCLNSDISHNVNDLIRANRNLKFTINFNGMETELIPKKMNMDFYPLTNKLVLYKDSNIYAVFFKNPVLSELEQISKEAKKTDPLMTHLKKTVDENCEEI